MILTSTRALLALFVLAATLPAQQGEKPAEPPVEEAQDPAKEMMRSFEENDLTVDLEKKTITIECTIVPELDPLEFLLIEPRGKSHEALFETRCKASVLNAAFLLLGYERGENAKVVDRDPMPTQEEALAGAPTIDVVPPKGEKVWFTVRWKKLDEEKGEEFEIEVPVEDLILDMTTGRPVAGASWIYLGGNMARIYRNEDPVFVADYEGNHVSVVYKHPPNHLVTMRHPLASDDTVWWRTDLTPPHGTKVELIAHKTEPAMHKERRARLDPDGLLEEDERDDPNEDPDGLLEKDEPDAPRKDAGGPRERDEPR